VTDRAGPLCDLVSAIRNAKGSEVPVELRVLCPESSQVAGLEKFCGSFSNALRSVLKKRDLITVRAQKALDTDDGDESSHSVSLVVVFISFHRCAICLRPWKDGAQAARRGRVSRGHDAPSRSGSKLAEAFRFFQIPTGDSGGVRLAVDLGAAPGGWTAFLLEKGFMVHAVDNGPMDPILMERYSGKVIHVREDAFRFAVDKAADLLVCDVVDQPARVTDLMLRWALQSQVKTLVFNLKLPMKLCYEEISICLAKLRSGLDAGVSSHRTEAHQLFHDRKEVTVVISHIIR
jgi:23S rRNA (cytidine2498-2'-O)-methyltransferase